jgi:hypothetical protein
MPCSCAARARHFVYLPFFFIVLLRIFCHKRPCKEGCSKPEQPVTQSHRVCHLLNQSPQVWDVSFATEALRRRAKRGKTDVCITRCFLLCASVSLWPFLVPIILVLI